MVGGGVLSPLQPWKRQSRTHTCPTSLLQPAGPCCGLNPHAPCMKDGVCTKDFPKAFNDATRDDGDGYPVYRCVAVGVGCLRPWHEGDPTQTAGDCAMNPELWYEGPPPLQHHVRECVHLAKGLCSPNLAPTGAEMMVAPLRKLWGTSRLR